MSSSSSSSSTPGASTPEPSLSGGWYKKRDTPPPPSSERLDLPPPPALEGRRDWAMGIGFVGGIVGGAGMIFTAREVARRVHSSVDVVQTMGSTTGLFGDNAPVTSLVLACVTGAIVGMAFGALMRHSLRRTARLLTGVILAPALWTFAHAFVFKSFAPTKLGALPFGPMIAGAAIYGICVAIVKPPVVKRDDDE